MQTKPAKSAVATLTTKDLHRYAEFLFKAIQQEFADDPTCANFRSMLWDLLSDLERSVRRGKRNSRAVQAFKVKVEAARAVLEMLDGEIVHRKFLPPTYKTNYHQVAETMVQELITLHEAHEQRFREARRSAGKKGGTARSQKTHSIHEGIRADARRLLANDRSERELAGVLAQKYNLSHRQIRNILRPPKKSGN